MAKERCATFALMKKLLLVALLSSYAFAADIAQITETGKPLSGAIEELSSDFSSAFAGGYIPGYGLSFVGTFAPYNMLSESETAPLIEATQGVLAGLAPTVKGLNPGEWVSITATVAQSPATYITIRVKPDQPDSLEVWVDGVKR